jgi:DNA-binding PadR family transcriptional regulator
MYTYIGPPVTPILAAFAKEYPRPLKQYDLREGLKNAVHVKSIQNWLPKMGELGWIEGRVLRKSRQGDVVEYHLTELGLIQAANLNPEFSHKVRSLLGEEKYHSYELRRMGVEERRLGELIQVIRQAIGSGKATPGWRLTLRIIADRRGNVRYGCTVGFPERRKTRKKKQNGVSRP